MNTIKKLSELAAYLKQVVATYSQHDYGQLHQELRARYEQMIMEAFMERRPGWSVVEGNTACMMYLYRNWAFAEKAEENVVKEPEQAPMAEVVSKFGNKPDFDSQAVVMPDLSTVEKSVEKSSNARPEKVETESAKPSIIDLANNPDFSVATIAKEANRIKERDEGEVFISLH